ncbi:MAG: 1-deoxy-D-xylulose-5-phosphate reductoisomerase, partial [Gaiellales bacterium]
ALHQLIAGERAGTVERLVVTASGGPFRGRTRAELEAVTVEQALRHPTWAMGGKITIDSATLMNKGLGVIEAHHLFGTPYDRIDVALANKESLVVGGELVTALAEATGAQLIPVDSEHSALHQLISGERAGTVDRLVVTASGGPFRGWTSERLEGVTPEQALRHPTWAMGAKITVDSATLMNKGLELIEAHELFGVPYDRIEVVVHPQSTVHALVRFRDGALIAHLGEPDMRVPISYALTYPERAATPAARVDLGAPFSLEFLPPDLDAFPCLRLAREAGEAGGTSPCTLNAANEVAVGAFLAGRLRFTGIAEVCERVLDGAGTAIIESLDQVLESDRRARAAAEQLVSVAA